jgi:hypothetical protein
LLFLVALTGCIPESEHPITPLYSAEQDKELTGLWTSEDEESVRYLHIGAELEKGITEDEAEEGLMRFWLVTHRTSDGRTGVEKPFSMRFFVSKCRENQFANAVLPIEETPGVPAAGAAKYYFMKYKIVGDELNVWGIDFAAAAAAIDRGELGGTVVREGSELKSVQFTDSSEHLMVYLSGGGADKLFPEKGKTVFRRIH